MARRRDRPRKLTAPADRPPLVRELSAGGLVYRRVRGRLEVVLAARLSPDRGEPVWGIPKGHVEKGESMAETALREVREETGLEASIDDPLGDVTYWYARRDAGAQAVRIHKRVRFFLMRYVGGRFANRDHEMDDVRWFDLPAAIEAVAFANERALLEQAAAVLTRNAPR
jgi:8-oxo-dGTP pyrophosphatase MutT (NUDIX family)